MPRSDTRIEVTLDMDTKGALNVYTTANTAGKVNHMPRTKIMGCLSKQEIECMASSSRPRAP